MGKNKNYSSKTKAKIIKELIEHKKTHSDMAVKYNISVKTIHLWYKKLLNSLEKVFSDKTKERIVGNKQQKESQHIKEMKIQFNWLKKTVKKLNVNAKKTLVDRNEKELSIAAQCKILGLNRSSLYYCPKNKTEDS